jgi:photosystem II stability/assembly factor-like uncharacterized protein
MEKHRSGGGRCQIIGNFLFFPENDLRGRGSISRGINFPKCFFGKDGGEKWNSAGTGLSGNWITDLVMNPRTPTIAYASTNKGLFKSTDGGGSWQATAKLAGWEEHPPNILNLAMDPIASDTLYMMVRETDYTVGERIYRSDDGGVNWTAVVDSGQMHGFTDFVVAPTEPESIYVGMDDGMIRSGDNGATWKRVDPGIHGGEVKFIVVDPRSPVTLYAGVKWTWKDQWGWETSDEIWKTVDGGENWAKLFSGWGRCCINALAMDAKSNSLYVAAWDGIYKSAADFINWRVVNNGLSDPMIYTVAVDPENPETIYAGTRAGVYKTANGGRVWTAINNGLTATVVSAIAADPADPRIFYAAIGDRGVRKSTNGGTTWSEANSGLYGMNARTIFSLRVDPARAHIIYAGTLNGVYKSVNGAGSWFAVNAGLIDPRRKNSAGISDVEIDPSATSTLYAGSMDGSVFKSIDGGLHWWGISDGLAGMPVNTLAVDPKQPKRVYAGAGDGVYLSLDGGENWTLITSGLCCYLNVMDLAVDPSSPDTIYAGTEFGGVMKSTDAGETWRPANSGLPRMQDSPIQVGDLIIDPDTPSVLYAGTPQGVFRSADGGESWSAFNNGLGSLSISDLIFRQTAPISLFAATVGGGIFVIP